jgi:hypothetical protein|tara:strand:+ start:970 stop:1119 length:150 start_codon:yes stop_codon:yes gene_type:complete
MFEYTHYVQGSDNTKWGIFTNRGQAYIMKQALSQRFNSEGKEFEVKEIV